MMMVRRKDSDSETREWNLLVLGYSILEKFWENSSIYSYLILEFSGTRVYTRTQYLSKYDV